MSSNTFEVDIDRLESVINFGAPVKAGRVSWMRESYVEGPTRHDDTESCVHGREVLDEALTGVLAGRPLSRVIWTPWSESREDRGAEAVKM